MVDQEKAIETAYRNHLEYAHLFLDPIDAKKNIAFSVGAEKTEGIEVYYKEFKASRKTIVN